MGTVLQVFFKPHATISDRTLFEIIETDFEDLEEALTAIATDELISCVGLDSHFDRDGERNLRVIHQERPFAFRGGAVDRVQLPTWRFVREEA